MDADDDLTPEQLLEYLKQVDTNEVLTDIIIKPEKPKIIRTTSSEKEEYVFRETPEVIDSITRDDFDVVPPKVYNDVFFEIETPDLTEDSLGVANNAKLDALINYWELSAVIE